jgi:uncharacterized protein YaiE (UPF0345 family)
MDIVSLNLPALFKLECYDLSYYAKWTGKAVGIPAFLGLFVTVAHLRRDKSDDQFAPAVRRQRARAALERNIETAMFLSYTSVFNSVLDIQSYRTLGSGSSKLVLKSDYTVSTSTSEHRVYLCVAGALTLLLVTFPLWTLYSALKEPGERELERAKARARDHKSVLSELDQSRIQLDWTDETSNQAEKEGVIQDELKKLRLRDDYRESCEYYEAVDFLRKVLVLVCAWVGEPQSVSRPVFASLVTLGFSFVHIRLWPYQQTETNMFKAASDYCILFVFFLCSLRTASSSVDLDDGYFRFVRNLILLMWRVGVPLWFVVTVFKNLHRRWSKRRSTAQAFAADFAAISFTSVEPMEMELADHALGSQTPVVPEDIVEPPAGSFSMEQPKQNELQAERIVADRLKDGQPESHREFKVRWKDRDASEDSWVRGEAVKHTMTGWWNIHQQYQAQSSVMSQSPAPALPSAGLGPGEGDE